MMNTQVEIPKKKSRKFRTKDEAIKAISKSINKEMTEKHLKRLLNDSNNR
jgi:hypothetical protein